jgi:hypothetical protein
MRRGSHPVVFGCISKWSFASNNATAGERSRIRPGLIPVSINATNIGTGIVVTVISNESGKYQFASCSRSRAQEFKAELSGFRQRSSVPTRRRPAGAIEFHIADRRGGCNINDVRLNGVRCSRPVQLIGTILPEYKVRDCRSARAMYSAW